ncbi:unnamed protein product [Didymodactylos carnosus]|uniref:Uncharacterized protein n=1 Tax=Didymodactylos carnosus TaxID=1234261 RepID=A0A815E178_9BILA|nr:unnamed protein product [Didymodactylos carnosus]CAF1305278.1 unnamed protein product [Didymodactylos carnosus]CAF3899806.1 unnamed protein product [Didymodactylos carnosus]CAF4137439.1 unnamed protein product [Didymodactylos carnosus]
MFDPSIKQDQTHKNLSSENGNFVWFQLFIHVLIQMEENDDQHKTSMRNLIEVLKQYYKENHTQLDKLNKFLTTYTPSQSIYANI